MIYIGGFRLVRPWG